MKRRKFIGFMALALAGIGAGGYLFYERFDAVARKIIIKDTASLKIAPEEYEKFFRDAVRNKTWSRMLPSSHLQMIKWHYYLDNRLVGLPYASSYEINRSKIVGAFLLSTDFFQNKMDASRPVKYTQLFNPYFAPCSNPFSNLYYPDA